MTGREALDEARRQDCGFLTETLLADVARDPETWLTLLLVRCDRGRFLAPASDVAALVEAVEAAGWVVRDCSMRERRREARAVRAAELEADRAPDASDPPDKED